MSLFQEAPELSLMHADDGRPSASPGTVTQLN